MKTVLEIIPWLNFSLRLTLFLLQWLVAFSIAGLVVTELMGGEPGEPEVHTLNITSR